MSGELSFPFTFESKTYTATAHISLEDDGCYIFATVKDSDIVQYFGSEIDFEIRENEVYEFRSTENDKLTVLKRAILKAAKQLPEYQRQNGLLKVRLVAKQK